jgi:glycosyltransferase involved in cell wall biosynthesis
MQADAAIISDDTAPHRPASLSWALCVSTYNRIDILKICVHHALKQTRMPDEIVIVDASADWQGNSRRIIPMAETAGVPIRYLPAPKKSLPVQRNHGANAATADILFMIDDDAFLSADCAETIMRIYEADRDQRIAAVSATDGPMPSETGLVAEAKTGASKAKTTENLLSRSAVLRFLWIELLMMSAERIFIPYDGDWHRPDEATVTAYASDKVFPLATIVGYRLTVRRSVVLAEPFDEDLLAYAASEDFDATYRFSRHGWNVGASEAKLYHHEAMTARLKRQQSTLLAAVNIAFCLRKHMRFPVRQTFQFFLMMARRMLAEFLKDFLSRRWTFPQFRGVAGALPTTIAIMRHDRATLVAFHDKIQRKVLGLPSEAKS